MKSDCCWLNPIESQHFLRFFPQQRKLMGSSAQNSSGVDWCRRRVRFNEVRRRFRRFWEALVQSGQVQQGSRVPEKIPAGFGVEPGQVQEGSGEGSGEGLGGFGAEPGQFQQGFGDVSGEGSGRLWCRARSGSTGSAEGFQHLALQHGSERFV